MNEIRTNISACRCGEILAKDVINEKGIILVGKNTVLNDFIIFKLKELGIRVVWIYENDNKGEYECRRHNNKLLDIKTIINTLAGGRRLIYESESYRTNLIYKTLIHSNYLTTYMKELYNYDEYTYSHSINVAFYAMLIGKLLHLKEKEILDIIQAGLLHDIGKMKIPKDILRKKSQLTTSEYVIMKQHSALGYEMLKHSTMIDNNIKEAVLMHHERIDGSGYPASAKEECIGEYAKIIAIADVYDAMTSDRPYKKRATPFKALHMFSTTGASEFDTSIVRAFSLNISSNLVGAKVLLDNGLIGEVVYVPPNEIDKPIIRVKSSYVEVTNNSGPQIDYVL